MNHSLHTRSAAWWCLDLSVRLLYVLIGLFVFLSSHLAVAQQANVGACNTGVNVPWVNSSTPAFTVVQSSSATFGSAGWTPLFTNTAPLVIDNNLTNKGQFSLLALGSGGIRVTDNANTYNAGNFVGFKVDGGFGSTLLIRTYNNNVLQESQTIPYVAGVREVGFITTTTYDAIELQMSTALGSSIDVYYALNAKICAGATLPECNSPVALNWPAYPVEVSAFTEGVLPVGSDVLSATAAISASTTDFATLNLGTVTASLAVKDNITTYPAGTFAGFDVENIDFVADKFGGLAVTTYLNGVQQETSVLINVLLLANSEQSLVSLGVSAVGRQTVGFVTAKPFDQVKISYAKADLLISTAEHATKVYSAVLDARCSGATLACNTAADFTFPAFPVSEYSGALGGCLSPMFGQGALTTADTSDFVGIIDGVAIGCGQWVGVKNNRSGDSYPAGTFAGFEILQLGVVSISAADFGTVTTYLDGVQQEQSTSANLIATSFVVGKKRIVGFKTTLPFDEVRYSKITIAAAGLTTTQIHRAVIEKVCPGPALACNVLTTLNKPDYPLTTTSYMVPYAVVAGCAGTVTGEDALVSTDPNDYALMTMVQSLGCNRYVAVKDNATVYPAGTYAGMEIENQSLITASIGDFQYVQTYLNGVFQEQSVRGSAVTATVLTGGRQVFGFKTTKPFDEIRYAEFTVLTPATLVATRIYGAVVEKFCAGTAPTCSTPNNVPGLESDYVRLNSPASATAANTGYPVTLKTDSNDAFLGIAVCTNQLLNPERAISADPLDYASIALTGVNCAASMTFELNSQTMTAGTWAGVEVENTTAANLDLIGGITVLTYLGNTLQEFRTGVGLIDLSIGASTKKKIGFITSKPYDRIKYIQGSLIGAALGTTRVYGALVRELCAAPALVCNEQKVLSAPEYPISTTSGIFGGCITGVANADALGTTDPNDYAFFTLGANILCSRYVAVKDHKTTYPVGTYAGFDVQFGAVAEVALNGYKIETYLNGVKQEEHDASMQVSYGLYAGTLRFPVGFTTTKAFDEIRYVLGSLAAVSISEVRVYNAFLIKPCQPATVACNETYELTPSATGFPIVVNGTNSGITGACLGCYISNAGNVLTPSATDYAEIGMLASVLNEAKIAVKNPLLSYPAGTQVGFSYQNVAGVFDAALFNATKITTFLNGLAVETKSATNLIEVPILTDWSTPAIKNIGFTATQPFDEVQIAFSNTTGTFRVYGAFINTQTSAGPIGTAALSCSCSSGTVSPAMTTTALATVCPATTADLNTAFTGTAPASTSLVWATAPVATTTNTVANSTSAVAGTYYAFFYDAVNRCYSPASTSVVVTVTPCTAPSLVVLSPVASTSANATPVISGTATPGSTITVTGGSGSTGGPVSVTASPTGAWSTSALTFPAGPASFTAVAGNALGTSAPVPVSFTAVSNSLTVNTSPTTLTGVQGSNLTGSAASVLNPSGGTSPFTYSVYDPANGSSVPGTTSPTAHGTVTINPTTGAFTYTPNAGYSGPDTIGIRVCDASSTPVCEMVSVPVSVAAVSTNCAVPAATITK